MDLKSKDDGVWQVKYKGSLFTAPALDTTMLGSDKDEYDDNDFVQGDTKRAILNTTSSMIYLPKPEWDSMLSLVSAIPGVNCSSAVFPWSSTTAE